MMGLSLQARLVMLLAGLLILLGTHWRVYTIGANHERNAMQAAQTQATHESATAAIHQANNTIEAQHDRTKTETRIATDRVATAGELDRLRNDLFAAQAAATRTDACTTDSAARDSLLEAMARDIEKLAEQGAAIAAAADGHAADALMLWRIAKPAEPE